MYEEFYNFRERPFNLTPDPKFLFLSERHREALAHLLYGIRQRCGFILLTGEVGTGKTTLCRALLRSLDDDTEIALILNPNMSAVELLQAVNHEFGLPGAAESRKALVDELNRHLLARRAAEKNLVLLVDEAQNLPPSVLEELRLLSNLETEKEKLLQIVLIGQPELKELLRRPELRQLDQRMSVRYHLSPLDQRETGDYIDHRLGVASESPGARFSRAAVRGIYGFSRGAPRLINVVADRALLAGFTRSRRRITHGIVRGALREVRGQGASRRRPWVFAAAAAATAAAFVAGIFLWPAARGPILGMTSAFIERGRTAFRADASGASARMGLRPASLRGEAAGGPRMLRVVTPSSVSLVPEELLPAPPAPDALLRTLAAQEPGRAWTAAVNAVLRRWDAGLVTGSDVAYDLQVAAEGAGLLSTRWNGSLAELTKVNLPALIEVENAGGGPRIIAVIGYDERGFITNLDDQARIPISALDSLWTGNATIFWKDHGAMGDDLKDGAAGPGVLWLKNALTTLGFYHGPPTAEYDLNLHVSVAAFQAAHGLDPDGIVGEQTKMILYSLIDSYHSPRLTASR